MKNENANVNKKRMKFVYEKQKLKSKFILCDTLHMEPDLLKEKNLYKFIWILSGKVELIINHQMHVFNAGEMITLSYLHTLDLGEIAGTYQSLLFNDNFYNISDNDHEVMCNGILFNGSSNVINFVIPAEDRNNLDMIVQMMKDEFSIEDDLQGEMLRILLKRQIILCCRLARNKHGEIAHHNSRFETMRKFYILVDEHFRDKKQVQEYATLLHKSPKTITNILSTFHQPSAIKIIHNRIITEAKRLLHYTSKSSKEIAHILGFENQATFSRFFKNFTGHSPTEFRRNIH